MKLAGWGRFPVRETRLIQPRDLDDLARLVAAGPGGAIARGNGRAYGDSAVGTATTIDMRRFDRLIAFDPGTGQLVAEAGLQLGEIIRLFLPRGFFPAVTPGTKFVTIGGAIAADVHGKNHHRDGSFGRFVDWIDLMDAGGRMHRCSSTENAELFEWTIGGMGLTGVILRAAIRLRPVETGWIRQTTIPAPDLTTAIDAFEGAAEATYSVAWIDCLAGGDQLGRSLVMLGEHAKRGDLPAKWQARPFETGGKRSRSVPIDAPPGLLNRFTVGAFNRLYYWNGARQAGDRLVDWDSYFYPLDAILGWNRIYGRRGFAQFQCVLPLESSKAGLTALLTAIARAGSGSFLAVLKRFGPQTGRISFPMPGYTLALDFPVSRRTLALLDTLDRITVDHGGRFYLAKDARLSAETLGRADPRWRDFATMRQTAGLRPVFRSGQSERLDL